MIKITVWIWSYWYEDVLSEEDKSGLAVKRNWVACSKFWFTDWDCTVCWLVLVSNKLFENNGTKLLGYIDDVKEVSCSSRNWSSVLKTMFLNLRWFLSVSFLKSGIIL